MPENEETGLAVAGATGLATVDAEPEEEVTEEREPPADNIFNFSVEDIELVRRSYARYIAVKGERERPKEPLSYDELSNMEKRAWQMAVLG